MNSAGLLIAAFLLGSLPFSYLVARGFGVADVRRVGSGNVGATNVMRSAGKVAGVLAFLLDALKGYAATWLALRFADHPAIPAAAALCAMLGHVFPPWLGFRGGKGVATGAGAFLPLAPQAVGIALLAFPLTLALTRYVSVASMAGSLVLTAGCLALGSTPEVTLAAACSSVLVIAKHRANLERLAAGREPRLGAPREPQP
jgi:glycerol-3-phosphate acyltransferase PlsY